MRVLRARGLVRPRKHDQESAPASQPEDRDRGPAAYDVRSAQHACTAGVGAAAGTFRRQGLRDGNPAQRAARGSAELRRARDQLRSRMQGLAGVHRARERDPQPQRRGGSGIGTKVSMATRQKGLGRGLDALLDKEAAGAGGTETQATVRVDRLQRGRYQPRTNMDEASLQDLAASIKAQGLMQPILVRPVNGAGDGPRYEIIAGERRWRAAKIAGLAEVPVLVRDVPDSSALAMALIENIQREDLNPLEEANGVRRLVEEFKLTHQEAADAIGRSRTATTNLLRLLQLQKPVQQLMIDGR